ncbi:hypothetical protein HD554DRAFT_2036701 [Boletus coccyginus]|nr:hypothetical protein HD554DRAFT_2036701 [Boletus coccyginus]
MAASRAPTFCGNDCSSSVENGIGRSESNMEYASLIIDDKLPSTPLCMSRFDILSEVNWFHGGLTQSLIFRKGRRRNTDIIVDLECIEARLWASMIHVAIDTGRTAGPSDAATAQLNRKIGASQSAVRKGERCIGFEPPRHPIYPEGTHGIKFLVLSLAPVAGYKCILQETYKKTHDLIRGVSVSVSNWAPSTADFNAESTTINIHPIPSQARIGMAQGLELPSRFLRGILQAVHRREKDGTYRSTPPHFCERMLDKTEPSNLDSTVTHLMQVGSSRKEMSQASGKLAIGYRYHSQAGERLSHQSNMKNAIKLYLRIFPQRRTTVVGMREAQTASWKKGGGAVSSKTLVFAFVSHCGRDRVAVYVLRGKSIRPICGNKGVNVNKITKESFSQADLDVSRLIFGGSAP